MRRAATLLLGAVLLVALAAPASNAWIRERMYDGYTPSSPQYGFALKNPWGLEIRDSGEELRSGELNGPAGQRRFCYRGAVGNTQGKIDVRITIPSNNAVTSAFWEGCIFTRTGSNGPSQKAPMIRIRTPFGSVKVRYNNDTALGTRGWYVSTGTDEGVRTGGGVILWGTVYGCPVDHGIWHTVRLTVYPNDLTWHLWINDGTGASSELWGNLSTTTGAMINWCVPEATYNAEIYTTRFYWGQGEGEIDPIPGPGESYDIGGVIVTPSGNSATIKWVTENTATTTNRVYYGDTFHTLGSYVNATWVVDHWEAQLNDLDWNKTYTFYCESVSAGGQRYDTSLGTFRTGELVLANLNNPGFEAGVDIYPWVDVYAPTVIGDTQRWGRIYQDIDGPWNRTPFWELHPASGQAFAGAKLQSTELRKFATVRQKLAVTPGQWYKATAKFQAFGTSAYQLGRVMLDQSGDNTPGTLLGGSFTMDRDVWSSEIGGGQVGEYRTITTYTKAVGNQISVFLQWDYDATSGPLTFLAFDDATFEETAQPSIRTCAAVKRSGQLGDPVDLLNVIVTARRDVSPDVIGYVEDDDRAAGVRVVSAPSLWSSGLDVGKRVAVAGIIRKDANNEVYIDAKSVVASGSPLTLDPVGMTNRALGGSPAGPQVGVEKGQGVNNIGLLATIWGRVSVAGTVDSDIVVFIDDGSGMVGGLTGSTLTYPGIEVVIPEDTYVDPFSFIWGRTYLSVTGNSSTKLWDPDGNPATNNSVQKPILRVRTADDVVYVIP